jgi:hypothetical protein
MLAYWPSVLTFCLQYLADAEHVTNSGSEIHVDGPQYF